MNLFGEIKTDNNSFNSFNSLSLRQKDIINVEHKDRNYNPFNNYKFCTKIL